MPGRFHEADTRFDRAFYTGSHIITGAIAKVALGLKVYGAENYPDSGAAIAAANHRTELDMVALALSAQRHMRILARHDLFDNKIQRFLFTHWEAIPVHSPLHGEVFTADDYRRVITPLRKAKLLGIFPEETRGDREMRKSYPRANLGEFSSGVVLFSSRSEAPIVPVAISGLDHALSITPGRRAKVVVGEPFEAPANNKLSQAIALSELRLRIEQLYNQSLEM